MHMQCIAISAMSLQQAQVHVHDYICAFLGLCLSTLNGLAEALPLHLYIDTPTGSSAVSDGANNKKESKSVQYAYFA